MRDETPSESKVGPLRRRDLTSRRVSREGPYDSRGSFYVLSRRKSLRPGVLRGTTTTDVGDNRVGDYPLGPRDVGMRQRASK